MLRKTVFSVILLFALFLGACWWYAEPILNQLLKPQIEQTLSQTLEAKVNIESLKWTEQGLDVNNLRINQPNVYRLTFPKLEAEFSLATLWQRRLDALRVLSPTIEIAPTPEGPDHQNQAATFPGQLPLTIGKLIVSDADILIRLTDRRIRIQKASFKGALENKSDFKAKAYIGQNGNFLIALNGQITFSKSPTLTLTKADIGTTQLLSRPMHFKISSLGLEQGTGGLQIDQFDHEQLRSIISAVDGSYPLPDDVRFTLTKTHINFSLKGSTARIGLDIEKGLISKGNITLPFSLNNGQLTGKADTWQAHGELSAVADCSLSFSTDYANKHLSGRAEVHIPASDQLKTELFGGLPLGIAGGLRLDVDYSFYNGQQHIVASIEGQNTVLPADYWLNLARLSGRLELQNASGKELFNLDLQQAGHPLLNASGNLHNFDFSLSPLNLQTAELLLAPQRLPRQLQSLTGLSIRGQLTDTGTDRWAGNFELTALNSRFSDIDLEKLSAHGTLQIFSDKVILKNSIFKAEVYKNSSFKGLIAGKITSLINDKQFSIDLKKFSLEQINYLSSDEQSGLGNGRLAITGKIRGQLPFEKLEMDLNGTAAADEFLAGEFYADLSALESRFSVKGEVIPDKQLFITRALQINIPGLATVAGSARFSPDTISLRGTLEFADLAEAYENHIGPLLSEYQPAAAGLTLEGGLALDAELHWNQKGWRSFGELRPQGLDAYWEFHELELVDASGQLPFSIIAGLPGPPNPTDATTTKRLGEISFASLSVGLATLESGRLPVVATPNHFAFRSPLLLRLAGGRVAIADFSFGWGEEGPYGSTRLSIDAVDLASLTEELRLPLMQGNFTADLGRLQYAEQQLSSAGTASLDVFGGRILLRNMRYQAPFSRNPVFYADIDFSGLDLQQATRTYEFGEMNGIIDGQINGLRLFGTTPAAFDTRLETRPTGKRNISVKALNNLSILSQGGITAALSRGVYRFIDFYRYRKIGFACKLENDTFTLIGTARRNSKKYLVDGGLLPPRIDITTTTPTISFKEMVNRLSRIERTGN